MYLPTNNNTYTFIHTYINTYKCTNKLSVFMYV